jgi:hypothetical protein
VADFFGNIENRLRADLRSQVGGQIDREQVGLETSSYSIEQA